MSETRLVAARPVVALIALALLGVIVNWSPLGPLFAVRSVDPETGKVVFDTTADVNSGSATQKFSPESFDADQYVASLWDSRVVPWVQDHAVELGPLIAALAQDRQAAEKKYGVLSGDGAYSFIVRGHARVASVDTSTPVGVIVLDSPDFQQHEVRIYAGPLVFGTVLRDALSFIRFNDFTNQMQYASTAKSLNKRALSQAYGDVDPEQLAGRNIKFLGVFGESPDGAIELIPLKIQELSS